MGIIICPIHGESGFSMRFSKRIIDAIKLDVPLQDDVLKIFKINLFGDEDNEFLVSEEYLLLHSEFSDMNVPDEVDVNSEDAYDVFYSKLPALGGICFECLQAYKMRHNLLLLGFN